jgi:hypothetical protein
MIRRTPIRQHRQVLLPRAPTRHRGPLVPAQPGTQFLVRLALPDVPKSFRQATVAHLGAKMRAALGALRGMSTPRSE